MDLPTNNILIRRLGGDDKQIARELFLLLQEVFEVENVTAVSEAYLTKLLQNPAFFVYAAFYDDQLAGGLTAYELPMYDSECSQLYIYDVAVSPAFQRKGIGRQLLSAVQSYAADNGIAELFVQANEEDQHALDFYRSIGATEQNVIQFIYRK